VALAKHAPRRRDRGIKEVQLSREGGRGEKRRGKERRERRGTDHLRRGGGTGGTEPPNEIDIIVTFTLMTPINQ